MAAKVNKTALITGVLLFTSVFSFSFVDLPLAKATTVSIVVPDDYSTIQGAIDAAVDGDIIYVRNGTYHGSILINKSISLIGHGNASTTIVGSVEPPTSVLIRHDNVTLTGFTVQPANTIYHEGIHLLHVRHCNVTENRVKGITYGHGIWLYGSSENVIMKNEVHGNTIGISLGISNNNNISMNYATGNTNGIAFSSSAQNILSDNIIDDNSDCGLRLDADNNFILNNTVTNNAFGLFLLGQENILKNNTLLKNSYDFKVGSPTHSDGVQFLVNDVDTSNTVDGKPIIYWINKRNKKVPENAGCVALFNCSNMLIQNLSLSSNDACVLLVNTYNSIIQKNEFSRYHLGLFLYHSNNNLIHENDFTNSRYMSSAIYLVSCSNNTVFRNSIATHLEVPSPNAFVGVLLSGASENVICENTILGSYSTSNGMLLLGSSSYNVISRNIIDANDPTGLRLDDCAKGNIITENTIKNNEYGLLFSTTESNSFYRNNFVHNQVQMYDLRHGFPLTIWDDGYEGNYWSDYTGVDYDPDGIGERSYSGADGNEHNYPLSAPLVWFDAGVWEWNQYYVDVISSSKVSEFAFSPNEEPSISFNVKDNGENVPFCRVIIPKALLDSVNGWTVLVDGESTNYGIIEDENSTRIFFTYNSTAKNIKIIGTESIAEFHPILILPIFTALTLVALLYMKKVNGSRNFSATSIILIAKRFNNG